MFRELAERKTRVRRSGTRRLIALFAAGRLLMSRFGSCADTMASRPVKVICSKQLAVSQPGRYHLVSAAKSANVDSAYVELHINYQLGLISTMRLFCDVYASE